MIKDKFQFRINLKGKMLFLILSTTILIFIIAVGYIGISSRNMAYKSAKENADAVTAQSALRIENQLNVSMDAIRTLAQAFTSWKIWPDSLWQEYVRGMYHPVFKNNPQIYKLWDSWEKNMVDDDYYLPHGRYVNTFYRLDGDIKFSTAERSFENDPPLYAKIKNEARESIWEPYWDVFSEEGESKKFMTSMSVPILQNNKYAGIVAVDITMDELQSIVSEIKPMRDSYAFLISNGGVFIGHPDTSFIGKHIGTVLPEFDQAYTLSTKIKKGERISFRDVDSFKETEAYFSFSPIKVGKADTPWSIGLSIPVEVITEESTTNFMISILVTLIGLILLTVIIYIIAARIARPISRSTTMLKRIEEGDILNIEDINTSRTDEIGEMALSLNAVAHGLNETARFAEEIGKGNLESSFDTKSEKDVLGNALIEMRESLRKAREEETIRKEADEKQRWVTNGIARFGDVLRQDNDDLSQLSFNVIRNLVDYLDANQGALFVLNDKKEDDIFFELQAAIAYDRRRYLKKEVRVGEDLVGRAAHEKQSIYLIDVPEDYMQITSGMGTANPRVILIVPVMLNNVVFGVVEVASFNKLEKYQIEFVEKIGESIASTLNSVKVNQRTQRLLEDSQHQREELSSQEEEMRQNMEELQATQEEAARREFELRGLINALSSSTYTVEYDLYGTISDVNEPFARLVGLSKEQMIGMNHKDGVDLSGTSDEDYERFWEDLRHGIPRSDVSRIDYNNTEVYLQESYTPILDEDDNAYKILKIGFDITSLKKTEKELQTAEEKLSKLVEVSAEQEHELERIREQLNTEKAKNLHIQTKLEQIQKQMLTETPNTQPKADEQAESEAGDSKTQTSPGLMAFDNSMKVGIDELDQQHERVIDLLNDTVTSYINAAAKKTIKSQLATFADYLSWHFGNEEQYFETHGYEAIDEHKNEHNAILKEINTQIQSYTKGDAEALQQLLTYAKEKLAQHFTEVDTRYADFLHSKGL
ncbi:MAG: cache domain-containing protein [Salinivirgaceae bacterium]|nr:cache domain-containing protein [Salinivirgaceae bacterium]